MHVRSMPAGDFRSNGRTYQDAESTPGPAGRVTRSSSISFHALRLGVVLVLKAFGDDREAAHNAHGERRVGAEQQVLWHVIPRSGGPLEALAVPRLLLAPHLFLGGPYCHVSRSRHNIVSARPAAAVKLKLVSVSHDPRLTAAS